MKPRHRGIGRPDVLTTELLFLWLVFCGVLVVGYPFFVNRREQSRRATCQSNLKSLALHIKQYCQDYQDSFPPVSIGKQITPGGRKVSYGWMEVLQPYTRTHAVFQCPSGPEIHNMMGVRGCTDYYLNNRIAGKSERRFNYTAQTVLLGEGNDGQDQADSAYAYAFIPSLWLQTDGSPAKRHLDGANYAFVDAHVKWLPATRAPGTAKPDTGAFTFLP